MKVPFHAAESDVSFMILKSGGEHQWPRTALTELAANTIFLMEDMSSDSY